MSLATDTRTGIGPDQAARLRRAAFAMAILLLVQYALGIALNLYVRLPAKDAGGNIGSGFTRAVANGPASVSIHAVLGVLLVVNALVILVRSLQAGAHLVSALAVLGAASLVGAAVTGASFVTASRSGASMGMAMAWGVGLLCYLVIVYVLGERPARAR